MAIRFNLRNGVVICLATIFSSLAHANLIGNIKCGPENIGGEHIVCDYAIIGFKYQKLFDSQFSNGRSSDIEIKVQKDVVSCDSLQCVEAVIDSHMSTPAAEAVKKAPLPVITNSDKTSVIPDTKSNSSSSVNAPAISGVSKQSPFGAILFLLCLVALLFWIVFRKRSTPPKSKVPSNDAGFFFVFRKSC